MLLFIFVGLRVVRTARGQTTAVTLTGRLAGDRVGLGGDQGLALALELLNRVVHAVSLRKFFLALLDVYVQGVEILNDTASISRLTYCLYTTLVIVTVSALIVKC